MLVGRHRFHFIALMFCLLCFLVGGCASHPLGMSDEEWSALTPEQQLEARKQDELLKIERERLRQEEVQRRKEAQLQEDIANGMIFQFLPDAPYCMGGDRCPKGSFDELILSLHKLAEVDRIVFYADDNLGSKHDGLVSVLADTVLVSEKIDIKRVGAWHQVLVARPARNITIRPIGDDEVRISQVKVFGSWATGEQHYLIVKE